MKHNGRTTARWILASLSVPLLALAIANLSTGSLLAAGGISYQVFNSGQTTVTGSEIIDITPDAKFALSVGRNEPAVGGPGGPNNYRLHVISVSTETGVKKGDLNIRTALGGDTLGMTDPVASSVAIHPSGNYAIVTLREEADSGTAFGKAIFISYDPNTGDLQLTPGATPVTLGVNPESIAINQAGTYALVANEGNLQPMDAPGPNGSLTVIDLSSRTPQQILLPGTITNPNPEAVTISSKNVGFVSLQPNNAIAAVDLNPGSPTFLTPSVQVLGAMSPTINGYYPDGLTTTPDGNYLLSANEGIQGQRPATTSLWSISSTNTLTQVADYQHRATPGNPATTKINPEMVDVGPMFGALKAFVSLETGNAVEAFTVNTSTTPASLVFDERINLNPSGAFTGQMRPEGVAVVDRYVAVANTQVSNISVIVASQQGASPTPSASATPSGSASATPSASASATPSAQPSTPPAGNRVFLPVAQK